MSSLIQRLWKRRGAIKSLDEKGLLDPEIEEVLKELGVLSDEKGGGGRG